MLYKMDSELKSAWDKVLFWAKRLSYQSADKHPHWQERYDEAKAHLKSVKQRRYSK